MGVREHAELGRVVDARVGLLDAEALLGPQRDLVDVDRHLHGFAHLVGPAEEVGVVLAAVVLAGHPVLAPEGADVAVEANVLIAELGGDGEPRLGDAELGARLLPGGVGEVVALEPDGALGPRVAVREEELGPVLRLDAGVLPAQVLVVGDEGAVDGARALLGRRVVAVAEPEPQRSAEVAVEVELPVARRRGPSDAGADARWPAGIGWAPWGAAGAAGAAARPAG